MQNHKKLKLSVLSIALASVVAGYAYAQQTPPLQNGLPSVVAQKPATVQAPIAVQAPEQKIAVDQSPANEAVDPTAISEISKLKIEESKLKLQLSNAKLQMELDDLKGGIKPGGKAAPQQSQIDNVAAKALYNSFALSSIYGSGSKLTAEIMSNRGKIVVERGSILPTGETVSKITPTYVVLSLQESSRRLIPSAGDMAPAADNLAMLRNANAGYGPSSGMQPPEYSVPGFQAPLVPPLSMPMPPQADSTTMPPINQLGGR